MDHHVARCRIHALLLLVGWWGSAHPVPSLSDSAQPAPARTALAGATLITAHNPTPGTDVNCTHGRQENVKGLDLDLETLKKKLRDTDAIGLFTKLKLKGQVTDLVDALHKHHEGHGDVTLSQLHERYNLLLHKVLTLLQNHESDLAKQVAASREPLWCALVDPEEFNKVAVS